MTVNEWLTLAGTGVSLVQACIWPLLVLTIVFYLGSPLKKFIQDMGEFRIKASPTGIEAAAKLKPIEAAVLLGAASQAKDQQVSNEDQAQEIAKTVSNAVKAASKRGPRRAHILWVDDRPSNNLYERKAMEALGLRFTPSTSTEDAMEKIRAGRDYDVIISDMGRPLDQRAGYTLLAALQRENIRIPYIIYAGSNTSEHKEETRRRGGFGTTSNPLELIQLVSDALLSE